MSLAAKERLDFLKTEFKKGIDTDDARRKRDDDSVQIRKQKREDKLSKKRKDEGPPSFPNKQIDNHKIQMIYE